jgi:chromosome segregation ATPase
MTRLENERLRTELNTHKKEITVLRAERDSLMNTISKLDIELTEAEHKRLAQQPGRK